MNHDHDQRKESLIYFTSPQPRGPRPRFLPRYTQGELEGGKNPLLVFNGYETLCVRGTSFILSARPTQAKTAVKWILHFCYLLLIEIKI